MAAGEARIAVPGQALAEAPPEPEQDERGIWHEKDRLGRLRQPQTGPEPPLVEDDPGSVGGRPAASRRRPGGVSTIAGSGGSGIVRNGEDRGVGRQAAVRLVTSASLTVTIASAARAQPASRRAIRRRNGAGIAWASLPAPAWSTASWIDPAAAPDGLGDGGSGPQAPAAIARAPQAW